jgi:hypothetical protein
MNSVSNTKATDIDVLDGKIIKHFHNFFKTSDATLKPFYVISGAAIMNLILFPDVVLDRLSESEPGAIVDMAIVIIKAIARIAEIVGLTSFVTYLRNYFLEQLVN